MAAANILDSKRNYVGEQHRIVTRAQALRGGLEAQDPTIRHVPWTSPLVDPHSSDPAAEPAQAMPAAVHAAAKPAANAMERGEVTPYSALQSACLLLAALFERTPFSDTDIRKRVFADYSILKKDFRHSQLQTLHGPTTSIGELFGAIKDLDRAGLADNLTGIIFDDWAVHQRTDAFLNAGLSVQAMCLTQEGPVGKIACKLRTFVVLALLQERLLRELFESKFVGEPVRGYEAMTMEDPLDLLDFIEAMVRNTPNAYAAGKGMYYAWLYAPEVNASPEDWAVIFGSGANRLPSLYGRINTPDDVVVADPASESGYSMDLPAALKHDFDQSDAQAAIGFPWADDLIGTFLRKLRDAKQQQQPHGKAAGSKRSRADGKAAQPAGTASPPAPCSNGCHASGDQKADCDDLETALWAREEDCKVKLPHHLRPHGEGLQPDASGGRVKAEHEEEEKAGPGPGSAATGSTARTRVRKPAASASASATAGPPPPPDKLHLPLGIFLVGIITSSAYTNTQVHIEDLLLMSINVNIFGKQSQADPTEGIPLHLDPTRTARHVDVMLCGIHPVLRAKVCVPFLHMPNRIFIYLWMLVLPSCLQAPPRSGGGSPLKPYTPPLPFRRPQDLVVDPSTVCAVLQGLCRDADARWPRRPVHQGCRTLPHGQEPQPAGAPAAPEQAQGVWRAPHRADAGHGGAHLPGLRLPLHRLHGPQHRRVVQHVPRGAGLGRGAAVAREAAGAVPRRGKLHGKVSACPPACACTELNVNQRL